MAKHRTYYRVVARAEGGNWVESQPRPRTKPGALGLALHLERGGLQAQVEKITERVEIIPHTP